jgi:hypothetical protein
MGAVLRVSIWLAILLLSWTGSAFAEWQIRPGVGLNLGQNTTFVASQPSSSPGKVSWGAAAAVIGNVFGIEADFGRRSGFFPSKGAGAGIVVGSSVTTMTGNVTIALPEKMAEYTLRPYFVSGAGVMAVRIDQASELLSVSLNMKTIDIGGGVTGFLTKRIGLNWDVRHFRNIGETPDLTGRTFGGPPALSFWRAQMALAIRY